MRTLAKGRERMMKQRKKKNTKTSDGPSQTRDNSKPRHSRSERGDEATADMTSHATPSLPQTAASRARSSRRSQSNLPVYNEESLKSDVSELTWVDSEASSNKRSSLDSSKHSMAPGLKQGPEAEVEGGEASEESIAYLLPHASSPKGATATSAQHVENSHSSVVSDLTWIDSEGSTKKHSSQQSGSKSSLSLMEEEDGSNSEDDTINQLQPVSSTSLKGSLQNSTAAGSQSSLVSELTWHESEGSIPRNSASNRHCSSTKSQNVRHPARPQHQSNDQSTTISNSKWMGPKRSRPPLAERIPEAPGREEDDASKDKSSSGSDGSPRTGRTKSRKARHNPRKKKTHENHRKAPRHNAKSRTAVSKGRKRNTNTRQLDHDSHRPSADSKTTQRGLREHQRLPAESSSKGARPRSRNNQTTTKLVESTEAKAEESLEPPILAMESARALYRRRERGREDSQRSLNTNVSLRSPSPMASRPASRKSVTFADDNSSVEAPSQIPSAVPVLIRDWSEATPDQQPSNNKATASRISPPGRAVENRPPLPQRSTGDSEGITQLANSLDSCLLDSSVHAARDRPPMQPMQRRSSIDAQQNSTPIKLIASPRPSPRKRPGRRAEKKRIDDSKNRRKDVSESLRNLMIDQEAVESE
eukprot:scaffold4180_cov99-Cylindrotheca_fusiformis.AAC.7